MNVLLNIDVRIDLGSIASSIAALQVAAGPACGADVIATRNVRDYAGSPIRAVPPSDLVDSL